MLATFFHWLSGNASIVEREARRQKLDTAFQRFEETHDRASEAREAVMKCAEERSVVMAEACAATKSCAAVPATRVKGNLP